MNRRLRGAIKTSIGNAFKTGSVGGFYLVHRLEELLFGTVHFDWGGKGMVWIRFRLSSLGNDLFGVLCVVVLSRVEKDLLALQYNLLMIALFKLKLIYN